jgi:hypothetical protein
LRKLLVLTLLIGLLGTAGVASVALADPNLTLQAMPHRHFINGAEVGPRYCDNQDNPATKAAFTQFHANTHTHMGVTGEIGPVAPGLHNGRGGEITSGPCQPT